MLKTFRLAADARRAKAILGDLGMMGGQCGTLAEQAALAVRVIENHRASTMDLGARLSRAERDLALANAKIERMTSGLRRGSKPKHDA